VRIARYEFDPEAESLDVYVSGCVAACMGNGCPDCHNPELWPFEAGEPYADVKETLFDKLFLLRDSVKRVRIFGGEPLDQDVTDLSSLLVLPVTFGKEVWLFTGKDITKVPSYIIPLCDYIKTGRHDPDLNSYDVAGVTLSSYNQELYKIKGGVPFLLG
jgi:organic radical activating enzyme